MSIFSITFLLLCNLNIGAGCNLVFIDPGPIRGEENTKLAALPGHTGDLNRTPSTLDDVGTYRQPQPQPLTVLLGCKEGFKDPAEVLRPNPTPRIRDADPEALGLLAGSAPQRPPLGHGVPSIGDEVQQHLLQLVERHADGRQRLG